MHRDADDPGLQRFDFAQLAQFGVEIQANRLKYVGTIFRGGTILEWNRIDQPLVTLNQRIPRLLVASETFAHETVVAARFIDLQVRHRRLVLRVGAHAVSGLRIDKGLARFIQCKGARAEYREVPTKTWPSYRSSLTAAKIARRRSIVCSDPE